MLLLSCWRSQTQGTTQPLHRCEANNPTTVRDVFFKQYVEGIIIPQTNLRLQQEKHRPVSYGEILRWLGLWLLMSAINSPDCTDFGLWVRLIVLLVPR